MRPWRSKLRASVPGLGCPVAPDLRSARYGRDGACGCGGGRLANERQREGEACTPLPADPAQEGCSPNIRAFTQPSTARRGRHRPPRRTCEKRCARRSGGIPRPSSTSPVRSPCGWAPPCSPAPAPRLPPEQTLRRRPCTVCAPYDKKRKCPYPQVRRTGYRAGASHRPRRRAWSTSSLRAPRMIPACAQRSVQHFLSRGFVDESFGPSRALRAVWTARGQRWRVAHRLPPLACLSPTNSTGPATPCLQQRTTRKDRTAFVCSRHSRESHSPGTLTDARLDFSDIGPMTEATAHQHPPSATRLYAWAARNRSVLSSNKSVSS